MAPIRRVLVLVDARALGSAALHRAIYLARAADAQLHLLMCIFDPMIEQSAALANPELRRIARDHLLNQHRRWLEDRAATLTEQGLRVEHGIVWGEPGSEEPLARLRAAAPDLVISDLLPAGKRQRKMKMRAADWRLARQCPVPLMLVMQGSPHLPSRLAAAIDAGLDAPGGLHPVNAQIGASATQLAALSRAALHVVHVFPYRRPSAGIRLSAGLRTLHRELRGAVHERFKHFLRRYAVPDDRAHWIEGQTDVSTAIARFSAQHGIDLLVLGAGNCAANEYGTLGSVTQALLHSPMRDVLLVRPVQAAVMEAARSA